MFFDAFYSQYTQQDVFGRYTGHLVRTSFNKMADIPAILLKLVSNKMAGIPAILLKLVSTRWRI